MNEETKRPIRILQVVGRMDRGGTEALLMSLFRHVNRDEIMFDFVEQTTDHCDYDDEIQSLGGKIFRCPALNIRNIPAYRQWWEKFLTEHPEYYIVHGHSRGSAPIYLRVAKKLGRVAIIHCHNNSNGKGLRAVQRYIWQYPLRFFPDYYFACSADAGYSQFGKHRTFTIIRNGIETQKFIWNEEARNQLRKELGIENSFVIGNVARFVKQKNHKFLIDIICETKKIIPEAKFLLIGGHGEGTLEQDVREKIRKLNLQDDVLFLGVRDDVNELLQAMDLFLLPSHFEGLGIVNIEAQAAGLPCVVSKDVIPSEVNISNLVYFVSLAESASEWAEVILDIKNHYPVRRDMTEIIRSSGYDISSSLEYLTGFYKNLYKKKEAK